METEPRPVSRRHREVPAGNPGGTLGKNSGESEESGLEVSVADSTADAGFVSKRGHQGRHVIHSENTNSEPFSNSAGGTDTETVTLLTETKDTQVQREEVQGLIQREEVQGLTQNREYLLPVGCQRLSLVPEICGPVSPPAHWLPCPRPERGWGPPCGEPRHLHSPSGP